MIINRHQKIGIKQVIRREWMDKVLSMLLAGMSEVEIRNVLNEYLSNLMQSGGEGVRGMKTYRMSIGILSSWFTPTHELVDFRNRALKLASRLPKDEWLPFHWAMLSASYPFWFNVAKQAGRLLNLQEKVTQKQIADRLKEQYGDRETILRNTRYTVRSFVAWGVLKDSVVKGCYSQGPLYNIFDNKVAILMLEAALHATPEGKSGLGILLNNPAFFPFHLPAITCDFIYQSSNSIEVMQDGYNSLVKLRQVR